MAMEHVDLGVAEFEDPSASAALEEMRRMLARNFGVTVNGHNVVLRFSGMDVHMVVVSVTEYRDVRDEVPQ